LRLFIDECLSPRLAERLADMGHDVVHPLHVGRRGELDHTVRDRCIAEDRAIVTENGADFRELLGDVEIHPGLIILPCLDRESTWRLLLGAVELLEALGGDPMDHLVNHVIEFDQKGAPRLCALP
jgi:predicted nuclease of predicted toxin-antitoxin system